MEVPAGMEGQGARSSVCPCLLQWLLQAGVLHGTGNK